MGYWQEIHQPLRLAPDIEEVVIQDLDIYQHKNRLRGSQAAQEAEEMGCWQEIHQPLRLAPDIK